MTISLRNMSRSAVTRFSDKSSAPEVAALLQNISNARVETDWSDLIKEEVVMVLELIG